MDNPIVGVRFIGPNESFTDKYFKTGAEWFVGTVHNFSLSLARKFFSYPCFERADVAAGGKTFVVSAGRKLPEVAPNINLNAMDADRLVHLARYEFNRVVNPEGKSVDQVRAEVRTLSVIHSLDLAEDEALSNVVREISSDELGAIMPNAAAPDSPPEVERVAPALEDAPLESAKDNADQNTAPGQEPAPASPQTVAEMDKIQLAEYALEKFAVRLDKRTNIDDMRARVASLEERAAP